MEESRECVGVQEECRVQGVCGGFKECVEGSGSVLGSQEMFRGSGS